MTLNEVELKLTVNYALDMLTRGCPVVQQALWEQRVNLRKEKRNLIKKIILEGNIKNETEKT